MLWQLNDADSHHNHSHSWKNQCNIESQCNQSAVNCTIMINTSNDKYLLKPKTYPETGLRSRVSWIYQALLCLFCENINNIRCTEIPMQGWWCGIRIYGPWAFYTNHYDITQNLNWRDVSSLCDSLAIQNCGLDVYAQSLSRRWW